MKLPVISGSAAVKAFRKLGYEMDVQAWQPHHPASRQAAAPAPIHPQSC